MKAFKQTNYFKQLLSSPSVDFAHVANDFATVIYFVHLFFFFFFDLAPRLPTGRGDFFPGEASSLVSRVRPAAEIIQALFDLSNFFWLRHRRLIQIAAQQDRSRMLRTGLLLVRRRKAFLLSSDVFHFAQGCVKAPPNLISNIDVHVDSFNVAFFSISGERYAVYSSPASFLNKKIHMQ